MSWSNYPKCYDLGCIICHPHTYYNMPTFPKPKPFPGSFENYIAKKNEEYMNIVDYLVSAQNKRAELDKSIEAIRNFMDKPELGLQYLSNNKWMDFKYPITDKLFPGSTYRNKPQPQYRPYNHTELVNMLMNGTLFIREPDTYTQWTLESVLLNRAGVIYLSVKAPGASRSTNPEGLLAEYKIIRSADYVKCGVEINV